MLRRETIIALRARHTAFRIAVDILHPPQEGPPPPVPAMPILEPVDRDLVWAWVESERNRRRARHNRLVLGIGMGSLVAFVLLMAVIAEISQPPPQSPPPPARPILPVAE